VLALLAAFFTLGFFQRPDLARRLRGLPIDLGRPLTSHELLAQDHFFAEHAIEGEPMLPLTAFVYYAWLHACRMSHKKFDATPVVFRNVVVRHGVRLNTKDLRTLQGVCSEASFSEKLKFFTDDMVFTYNHSKGEFLFSDGEIVYAEGTIELGKTAPAFATKPFDESALVLTREDIYREFMLRGYDYQGHFQGLLRADLWGSTTEMATRNYRFYRQIKNVGNQSLIEWTDHWSSFLDSVTQIGLLWYKGESLFLAHRIDYIAIDPIKHAQCVREFGQTYASRFFVRSNLIPCFFQKAQK